MIDLYCVVYNVGGYAREDAPTPTVGGVYTDKARARAHAMISSGHVVPIVLDKMPPGIAHEIEVLGILHRE